MGSWLSFIALAVAPYASARIFTVNECFIDVTLYDYCVIDTLGATLGATLVIFAVRLGPVLLFHYGKEIFQKIVAAFDTSTLSSHSDSIIGRHANSASRKHEQVERDFRDLMLLLSSNAQIAHEAPQAMKKALSMSKSIDPTGSDCRLICQILSNQAIHQKPTNAAITTGFSLVALMFEARAIGSKQSLVLSNKISDIVHEAVGKFASQEQDPNGFVTQRQVEHSEQLDKAVLVIRKVARKVNELLKQDFDLQSLPASSVKYLWGVAAGMAQAYGYHPQTPEYDAVVDLLFREFFLTLIDFGNHDSGSFESFVGEAWLKLQNRTEIKEEHPQDSVTLGSVDGYLVRRGSPEFSETKRIEVIARRLVRPVTENI